LNEPVRLPQAACWKARFSFGGNELRRFVSPVAYLAITIEDQKKLLLESKETVEINFEASQLEK
jgi:hypothetical protein